VNAFLAGAHGVGKSFLGSRVALSAGYTSVSASQLIKEERQQKTWTVDKIVTDVDANQQALIAAVKRLNDLGSRLLIDGHFVLFGPDREIIKLGTSVFSGLNLACIILLEVPAEIAFERSRDRGAPYRSNEEVRQMMRLEKEQAKLVAATLGIDLVLLNSATEEELAAQLCAR
jgi:adenylate kinase